MNQWQDQTSYHQLEMDTRIPRVWELRGKTRVSSIVLTKDRAATSIWYLACEALGIRQHPVYAESADAAKEQALRVCCDALFNLVDDFKSRGVHPRVSTLPEAAPEVWHDNRGWWHRTEDEREYGPWPTRAEAERELTFYAASLEAHPHRLSPAVLRAAAEMPLADRLAVLRAIGVLDERNKLTPAYAEGAVPVSLLRQEAVPDAVSETRAHDVPESRTEAPGADPVAPAEGSTGFPGTPFK